MLRITLSIILASSGLSVAWSAPEDRGPRGSYIALSAGASLGTALDDDGNSGGGSRASSTDGGDEDDEELSSKEEL